MMKSDEYPGIDLKDDPDIEVTYPEELSTAASIWAEVKSISRDIIFAAVLAILIVVFIVQPVKVEGTSMLPRLESEERIFVNKIPFLEQAIRDDDYKPVARGEIVVFWYPDNPSQSFIKRVIGLPGETIRMDHRGQLFIDNRPVEEPYLSPERNRSPRMIPETYIKPHYYFVMGDNRDASNDSRSWGLVPEKYIYGKALFRYWPLGRAGTLD
ncbi:MAG: signal peptidase I [Acidobacteria bacterium]|nr:signal peptidase I [Acidobacteriota bacterium]